MKRRAVGNYNGAIPFQPLEATLVILGYGAIFVNVVFFIVAVIFYKRPVIQNLPRKLLLFNLLVFLLQVYYFFFFNL